MAANPRTLSEDGLEYLESSVTTAQPSEEESRSYYSTPIRNAATRRETAPRPRKQKVTVHLRSELIERVKNAAYWNPRLTVSGIVEMGIEDALSMIERENGGAYPQREEELRGGRPLK